LPLWARYVDAIRDDRPLPSIERKEIIDLAVPDRGMYLAYVQALERSHSSSLEQFKKSAAANDFVVYPHLRGKPAEFRGQIITIKGHIERVLKVPAPRYGSDEIQWVYTTNIQGPFKKEPPSAVVFTDLPPDVSVTKKLDMEVTFYGYFLGFVHFAGDPKLGERDVNCPYLIGKTLIVNKRTETNESPYSAELIAWTVGGILCALILAVLLNFWFRRADRRIQSQLADVRERHNPFSLEPTEPEGPPIAPPVDAPPPVAEPVNPPGENTPPAT
jgi:hypothetical protein